jgi:signal transduction histidine kinase
MLEIEFAALARAKGLDLVFVSTTLAVRTDRRLMRRLLQNLISNALKYTLSGRVLVGCRRVPGAARIEVWDTGLGIPPEHQRAVFAEFKRLDQGARVARGLGLGLSIVERLGRVLEQPIGLRSRPGRCSSSLRRLDRRRRSPAQSRARLSRPRRASRSTVSRS